MALENDNKKPTKSVGATEGDKKSVNGKAAAGIKGESSNASKKKGSYKLWYILFSLYKFSKHADEQTDQPTFNQTTPHVIKPNQMNRYKYME